MQVMGIGHFAGREVFYRSEVLQKRNTAPKSAFFQSGQTPASAG
jgi:hypothetical protein